MGKIVFLDVDGTIVDYENKIPVSAVTAIRQARQNGHKVYFNTGRSKAEIQPELEEIGFDGMIGGNGNYVEDEGKVVLHQAISINDEKKIVEWLHQRGLEFYLESNDGLFASENFKQRAKVTMQQYVLGKNPNLEETNGEPEDYMEGLVYGQELIREGINKISFVLDSYQDYLDAKEYFDNFEVGTWGGKDEQALFGDISPKGVNKSHAIDVLLNYLHASKKDTIAVGDAKIDIPMFEYCNVGVAMGNGGLEAKQAADYVTSDVDDDGLYKAFEHLKLI